MTPDEEKAFRKNKAAWAFFQAQPPGYRRLSVHRVVRAKRVDTRQGRLARLIEACEKGIRL